MKKNAALQKNAELCADLVLSNNPKTEHELIKLLSKFFDGFSIKQYKWGKITCADVTAEHVGGKDFNEYGDVNFYVPSCKTFYKRDKKGFIINIEYFGK
jgi:hypothetical protein